ncbi:toxin glutamine deamidase domain-containing protein [Streptomyces sp. NPDC059611]|uniref:toxin glutamine deamidase domain-containing protein n=1 Tax=Streptomyces sp. NPDC059611 TaxID=3346884 RepID=UPI0036B8AC8A
MDQAAAVIHHHTQGAKARAAEARRTNKQIDRALREANPHYQRGVTAYSHNCSHVAQAYELRPRGLDVEAGPDSTDGRDLAELGAAWRGSFSYCDSSDSDVGQSEVERAFGAPGSRGMVAVWWKNGGGHAFSIKNVGGKVRFIDGQPTPPVTDASHYFPRAKSSAFMRLDNKPTLSAGTLAPFIAG